jgi:hypothetical protein
MAPEFAYEPKSFNDKSVLTDGWHPAFLLAITDEPTPEGWAMYAQSPRMWRWHFGVWATPEAIATQAPEHQSAPSSQKFTPKGRQPASKAYEWTTYLLGRQIAPGERVNLDPLLPVPCRVKVARKDEYANIKDLEAWPEGAGYLTPALRATLATLLEPGQDAPPKASTSSPATPPAAAAYQPPSGVTGAPQPAITGGTGGGWGRR